MSSDADDILQMDVLKHANIYETLRGGDITISLKECFANNVESELDNYNIPYQVSEVEYTTNSISFLSR